MLVICVIGANEMTLASGVPMDGVFVRPNLVLADIGYGCGLEVAFGTNRCTTDSCRSIWDASKKWFKAA